MENFHDLLVGRRSIRRYTSEPVNPDDVRLILEAGLMAPTSKSSRPWSFVVVEDKDMLTRLSQCKDMGAGPIAKCPLAIVVTVDATKSDPYIEDASIAAAYMQLQAADLGLGSCWIQVRGRFGADGMPAEEYVQEALGIPETFPVICILTIGHPDEQRKPQATDKLLWERVSIGTWRNAE